VNDLPSTPYDNVPYVSTARTSTSPLRMEAIGRLLGLRAAGANAAQVLEVGCGDGGNVIPMALALPGSTFLGIDLAPTAIAKARAAAKAADVTNARFEVADLAELPGESPASIMSSRTACTRGCLHRHGRRCWSWRANGWRRRASPS